MESESQNPNPNEIPRPKSQPGPKRKPFDLRERTFEFAVRVLYISGTLPREGHGPMISGQLARSGASVGANSEEADGAATRADKRKTFIVARKEAREVRYWLRIIDRLRGEKLPVRADIQEATVLSAIVDKLE